MQIRAGYFTKAIKKGGILITNRNLCRGSKVQGGRCSPLNTIIEHCRFKLSNIHLKKSIVYSMLVNLIEPLSHINCIWRMLGCQRNDSRHRIDENQTTKRKYEEYMALGAPLEMMKLIFSDDKMEYFPSPTEMIENYCLPHVWCKMEHLQTRIYLYNALVKDGRVGQNRSWTCEHSSEWGRFKY